ncbi:MAG: protein-methionine-sulfoxide reductase heme-binding subunit MsrQ [Rhodospirillales bacterium]|jgi:sulfoxide reductase heme-binding subunit YedZ|nr:protein-methionine-sulfoxide reductase heme-binding subunit MsrQ [Rhodospirillales bacterium]
MTPETRIRRIVKPLVFVLCLTPLAWLVWRGLSGGLGANPIEAITRFLGDWAMRLVLVTLAVTPLRRLFGWPVLMRLRRMVGLFAFAYAVLHLSSYVVLDQFFYWPEIWADIVKRNFITVGMIAFLMLLALAATSTNAMVRRLGGKRWRRLHRLVYPAAVAVIVHFYMMAKADVREPLIYGAIAALLLGYRAVLGLRGRRRRKPTDTQTA